ncbi:MAG: hypothetical protein Q7K45_05140 [Nanoarchaeota archaeon]|nr:hypothetical protein [Nanoarchaeota archaeon]
MEYIETINGFGKIVLSTVEQSLLTQLNGVISGNVIKYTLGEKNQQTDRYESIMQDLFPMIPLVKGAGVWGPHYDAGYYTSKEEVRSYEELPLATQLCIGSQVRIGGVSTGIDLRILMPQEGYFMSVVLGRDYRTGDQLKYRDDIVNLLGVRENPVLVGAQIIKYKAPTNPAYGLAQVPHLKKILKLYDKAADLLESMEKTIGVSKKELQELRKDSLGHPNIALRKLSKIEYHKALEALTNQ